MGLRVTAPVEIRSATPTWQRVTFCFEVRISVYPVALIEICTRVALTIQLLEEQESSFELRVWPEKAFSRPTSRLEFINIAFFLEALFVSQRGSDLTYLGHVLGSPRIDLEVMGLRLPAPVEICSATPTRQHWHFLFRSEGISISYSPDRDLRRSSIDKSILE